MISQNKSIAFISDFMVVNFEDLGIGEAVAKAMRNMGWTSPTPIQEASIPEGLQGIDMLAQAQTGTGKTGAFGTIILERVKSGSKKPSALVLAPTRELAIQVSDELANLARFSKHVCVPIYGGASINAQADQLDRGADIVAGTPGRVKDMMNRRILDLSQVKVLVLDESDRMLDMGFIEDIEDIIRQTPSGRQTLLFSATMPEGVRRLAQSYMRKPKEIMVSKDEMVLDLTKQYYFNVGRKNKLWALCRVLDKEKPKAIIFCHTKRMVDTLVERLQKLEYKVEAIHGDMAQNKREKVMKRFREDKIDLLVATDVAARGLDIADVNYVINYDIPDHPDSYVHRIGRTGRAGREGTAITFLTSDEAHLLRAIVNYTGVNIEPKEVPDGEGQDTVRKVVDYDQISDLFGMVKFEVNIGKKDGVNRNKLINLVGKATRINDRSIGNMYIQEEVSMIEVHKDFANRMINDLPRSSFNGKKLTVKAHVKEE